MDKPFIKNLTSKALGVLEKSRSVLRQKWKWIRNYTEDKCERCHLLRGVDC